MASKPSLVCARTDDVSLLGIRYLSPPSNGQRPRNYSQLLFIDMRLMSNVANVNAAAEVSHKELRPHLCIKAVAHLPNLFQCVDPARANGPMISGV